MVYTDNGNRKDCLTVGKQRDEIGGSNLRAAANHQFSNNDMMSGITAVSSNNYQQSQKDRYSNNYANGMYDGPQSMSKARFGMS